MKRTARLAILGIALIAGLLAAFLVARSPGPQPPVVQASAPFPNLVDVLMAAGDLAVGTTFFEPKTSLGEDGRPTQNRHTSSFVQRSQTRETSSTTRSFASRFSMASR